jgi:hypothetical protein
MVYLMIYTFFKIDKKSKLQILIYYSLIALYCIAFIINSYTKYGFSSFGTRKGYYQDNNEDALIMWTKNIFFDEFKDHYNETIRNLEGKINIQ